MSLSKFLLQAVFALLLLIMPVIGGVPQDDSRYELCDFFGYYVQTKMLSQGKMPESFNMDSMKKVMYSTYPVTEKKHMDNFIALSPPEPGVFLLPIVLFPPDAAYYAWLAAVIVSIGLSLPLLADVFALSERQCQFAFPIVALSGPVWEVLRISKPTAFILIGFSLSLWFLSKRKDVLAACVLQAWTFKPHEILPVIAVALGARRFKYLLALLGITVFLVLATLPIVGVDSYMGWIEAVKLSVSHPEFASPHVQPTIKGQLLRILLFGGNVALQADSAIYVGIINKICSVVYVVSLLLLVWVGNLIKNRAEYLRLLVMCMPIGFWTSMHSHNYDLILLIPAMFAFLNLPVLKTFERKLRWGIYVLLGVCLLLFELPLYTVIHHFFIKPGIWMWSPHFFSLGIISFLFLGLVIASARSKSEQTA